MSTKTTHYKTNTNQESINSKIEIALKNTIEVGTSSKIEKRKIKENPRENLDDKSVGRKMGKLVNEMRQMARDRQQWRPALKNKNGTNKPLTPL